MNPEPLSAASEKRRKLERELIGSLAGNCADTIESAGWFDADLFLHPGFADLWRWAITAHPDGPAFWRKTSDLGIRDEVLNAMTETLTWDYGEHLAREIVQLAWLDRGEQRCGGADPGHGARRHEAGRGDCSRSFRSRSRSRRSRPRCAICRTPASRFCASWRRRIAAS